MFEYHGNNLTVDADGVSVTVALAEPLDIEKPLADLDLTAGEIVEAGQSVYVWASGYEGKLATVFDWEPAEDSDIELFQPGLGRSEVLQRFISKLPGGVLGLLEHCATEASQLVEVEDAHLRENGWDPYQEHRK